MLSTLDTAAIIVVSIGNLLSTGICVVYKGYCSHLRKKRGTVRDGILYKEMKYSLIKGTLSI
jgi:hypothetical protein